MPRSTPDNWQPAAPPGPHGATGHGQSRREPLTGGGDVGSTPAHEVVSRECPNGVPGPTAVQRPNQIAWRFPLIVHGCATPAGRLPYDATTRRARDCRVSIVLSWPPRTLIRAPLGWSATMGAGPG